jgi:AAA+ superfamily predicted ATPase
MEPMKFIFFQIVVLLAFGTPLWADNSDPFQHYTEAHRYWLREPSLLETRTLTEKSLGRFVSLPQMALHNLLSDPNGHWKVHVAANFAPFDGRRMPVSYQTTQMTKEETTENIAVNGYFFIYQDDFDGSRLVVSFDQEYNAESVIGTVKISYAPKDVMAAMQFQAEVQEYAYLKNPYRNAILHVSDQASYQFTFLNNVKDFKFAWDDLILNAQTKDLSFQLTESYLSHQTEYMNLNIKSQFGVLLYGPPGTGKSFLAQVLISSIWQGGLKDQSTFIVVSARHLQSVSAIKNLFAITKTLRTVCIFMEDIDLFGIKNREKMSADRAFESELLLNELLNGIDGVVENNNLLVIGTTNQIENVDPALLRSERFGYHLFFGLPSFDERMQFFNRFGKRHALWSEGLTAQWMAAQTEAFSGADIIELISIAKRFAYLENSWSGDLLVLTQDQFLRGIELIKTEHGTRVSSSGESRTFKAKIDPYLKALTELRRFEKKVSIESPSHLPRHW